MTRVTKYTFAEIPNVIFFSLIWGLPYMMVMLR